MGPPAASRPMRWYSAGRLKRSVRVCSVEGTGPVPGGRPPPQAMATSRRPAGGSRRRASGIVMQESRKRWASPWGARCTLWGRRMLAGSALGACSGPRPGGSLDCLP
jgi:hypothetical protein